MWCEQCMKRKRASDLHLLVDLHMPSEQLIPAGVEVVAFMLEEVSRHLNPQGPLDPG